MNCVTLGSFYVNGLYQEINMEVKQLNRLLTTVFDESQYVKMRIRMLVTSCP